VQLLKHILVHLKNTVGSTNACTGIS